MTSKDDYITSLQWRLENIKNEISELQKNIQDMFDEVRLRQEQAQHIVMLLKAEGSDVADPDLASLTNVAVAEIAYEYLSSSDNKLPMHYSDLSQAIMSKGVLIPGKNPSANLLSHISRDDRFVRTAPGTYGLRE